MTEPFFLRACQREKLGRPPIWFMRQAGRYLEEYRRIRAKYEMLEVCRNPDLACEVTLQPIRRFDLDAAIIFADILLPLEGMGVPFGFKKDHGPVIHSPVRTRSDIDSLRIPDPTETLPYVLQAIRQVRAELDPSIALIGFAGAPFTLASYMLEGGHSRNFSQTKRLMYGDPTLWNRLMEKVAEGTELYLRAQVAAGAQVLQLFDSWVGSLSPSDYAACVRPHVARILGNLQDLGVPLIYFGTSTSTLLPQFRGLGATVIGVDWRISLADAWKTLGADLAIQGNLDPLTLLAPPEVIDTKVREILEQAGGRPGHIFNLGHGIIPETPPEAVQTVIELVRQHSGEFSAAGSGRMDGSPEA